MTQKQANFLLATVSIGWGTSYIFMKVLADTVSPFTVVALRFGIAFLIMILMFNRKLISINIKMLSYSAIVGVLLCGIFISLMYGMKTTSASSAGFLTSTTVILVPVLQILITRKLPRKEVIYGVITVSIGLALLTIKDDFTFALGSLLCLVAALLYGIHIIVTNYFVKKVDAFQLGIFQLGFAFLFAFIGNFIFETPVLPNGVIEWSAILGLAIICSAYGFVIQPIAQKYTTPESTGFLFSLEPVFSAVFAFIFLNENMGGQEYVGALLILSGVLIANTSFKKQIVSKEM
ncbi:DMT family transporter [Bacillus cereus group sp. BY8-1LC]|uniref:DMT family transporter n=1 Tax=Bacillus cereus group sp. BY8-1LC TaxID=3018076 RepID=UPI0022E174A7|nr:DMT family transporter [Bacillus cereus group sp. BY8-1LC]MDA1795254.1 DMT family transporter [Bacillus cereus group sp. BY8-1LC]HEQ3524810.1 DMT family transporter [Bacillus cereus]HEQ3529635.1 DMT family transporter [Bacillus cereus]